MTETVVKIYDTTLRDGLRNSGAILSLAQKVQVARQLEVLRVDRLWRPLAGRTHASNCPSGE